MANRKLIKAAALLLVAAVLVQQASARSWQEDFDAADDNEGRWNRAGVLAWLGTHAWKVPCSFPVADAKVHMHAQAPGGC